MTSVGSRHVWVVRDCTSVDIDIYNFSCIPKWMVRDDAKPLQRALLDRALLDLGQIAYQTLVELPGRQVKMGRVRIGDFEAAHVRPSGRRGYQSLSIYRDRIKLFDARGTSERGVWQVVTLRPGEWVTEFLDLPAPAAPMARTRAAKNQRVRPARRW